MGHEAIGRVKVVGAEVHRIKVGDLVVMPFAYSDGTCTFCHEGLTSSGLVALQVAPRRKRFGFPAPTVRSLRFPPRLTVRWRPRSSRYPM